jgi:3-dehydroquinate synthase
VTLAEQRGLLSTADRDRVLGVMSSLGLALDSEYLTADLLRTATAAILKTRDGQLRTRSGSASSSTTSPSKSSPTH